MTASLHPFVGRDVPWLVDAQAAQRPNDVLIFWESFAGDATSWTYAQFAAETLAVAAGLARQGVRLGDFVAIHMDNCPQFLVAWVACSRIGAVAVTTNTRSTADELAFLLDHSRCVAAVTQRKHATLVRHAGSKLRWVAYVDDGGDESIAGPGTAELVRFEHLRDDPARAPQRTPAPLLPNNVIFTSGTTARPKGVVWTHANALWVASTTAMHYELTSLDVHPIYLPLFHTNALGLSFLATLWSGGTVVLMPRFSASRFWDVARRYRCTWAQMLWLTLRTIAAQPDPPGHHFRFWAALGDMTTVRERWGIKTLGIYGMTETVGLCVSTDLGFAGPEGSMGRPRPECEVEIRADDGAPAAIGETGCIWVRGVPGVSLFQGYLNDPAATAEVFDAEGWMNTGDMAMARPTGDLFFMGREKDMLRVGAENVAAVEIEAAIARVPGVVECAVVGKPDALLDEVPVAFVVAARPAAELQHAILAQCARVLSDFKRPREIRFVEALPKGLLDKILKTELRARLASEAQVQLAAPIVESRSSR